MILYVFVQLAEDVPPGIAAIIVGLITTGGLTLVNIRETRNARKDLRPHDGNGRKDDRSIGQVAYEGEQAVYRVADRQQAAEKETQRVATDAARAAKDAARHAAEAALAAKEAKTTATKIAAKVDALADKLDQHLESGNP